MALDAGMYKLFIIKKTGNGTYIILGEMWYI